MVESLDSAAMRHCRCPISRSRDLASPLAVRILWDLDHSGPALLPRAQLPLDLSDQLSPCVYVVNSESK